MRVLVILALLLGLAVPAFAQPGPSGTWSPSTGWSAQDDFERRANEMRSAHEERARQMRDDFEASRKRMDDDFNRTSNLVWGFIVFGAIATILIAIVGALRGRRRPVMVYEPLLEPAYPVAAAPTGTIDVTVIRLAIDGRASKFVQTELEAIVKAYDASTPESRARRLRELSIVLRRVRDSWIYGGADNDPLRPRDEALAAVARHVDEARSRVKQPATQMVSPSRPPVGLILVSIVVAARGELMTVTDLATAEDIRRALEAAVDRAASDLLAVEVVWMPSETGQQLSSLDLEAHYRTSELHPLDGSRAGKTFCTYCGGPFPMELVTCPHCGAPAREARAS
jgi:hypothetical protein